MAITIGSSTITGLGAGGLPSGSIIASNIANYQITREKLLASDIASTLDWGYYGLTSGYARIPNGLIIQWSGPITGLGSSSFTWSFPIAFPNRCVFAAGHELATGDSSGVDIGTAVSSYVASSTTQVSFSIDYGTQYVWAIGY